MLTIESLFLAPLVADSQTKIYSGMFESDVAFYFHFLFPRFDVLENMWTKVLTRQECQHIKQQ